MSKLEKIVVSSFFCIFLLLVLYDFTLGQKINIVRFGSLEITFFPNRFPKIAVKSETSPSSSPIPSPTPTQLPSNTNLSPLPSQPTNQSPLTTSTPLTLSTPSIPSTYPEFPTTSPTPTPSLTPAVFSDAECALSSSNSWRTKFWKNDNTKDLIVVNHQSYTYSASMYAYRDEFIEVSCRIDADNFSKVNLMIGVSDNSISTVMAIKIYQGGKLLDNLSKEIKPGYILTKTFDSSKNNSFYNNFSVNLSCKKTNDVCQVYFLEQ
ncbi:MAG: hypothetical protein KME30_29230 [Iphinoe sp. HA4291-MV1]|jgi:hypothetical protein|nr:hypothetical protein [Iphinoe sp. HA4291-MV1]